MKPLIRILFSGLVVLVLISLTGCANMNLASKVEPKADFGWTTPWTFVPGRTGTEDDLFAQSKVKAEGDMGLNMAKPGTLERLFPPVSSGILEVEISQRFEQDNSVKNLDTTNKHAKKPYIVAQEHYQLFIDPNKASRLKTYVGWQTAWAYRIHAPFAWWEIDGNYEMPRFYVIEGKGKKKRGMEYTDFEARGNRWYKVVTILILIPKPGSFGSMM